MEDAYRLLADIEMKTTTKLPCFKADKSFGNIGKLVPERIFQQDYRDCKNITMFRVQLASRDLLFIFFLVNEKVQKQLGASGCGLFALAFAADLCHGLDPANRSYDQAKIREHLMYQLPWSQNKYSFSNNHSESSLSHEY